jgi:hypothetical protein
MTETSFTVFRSSDGGYGFLHCYDCTPEEATTTAARFYSGWSGGGVRIVAWMPGEFLSAGSGKLSCAVAESIAAGRTIEMVDGKYVPRGVPVEDKPATEAVLLDALIEQTWRDVDAIRAANSTKERTRPALTWADSKPDFDPWKGFFTEPADMADWQDTYYPR